MTSPFVRYPHTPHLAWLGAGSPRDDKVLSPSAAERLLAGPVHVEEKVDGANVGFSVDEAGHIQAQNRGSFLDPRGAEPQFRELWSWLYAREPSFVRALSSGLILFGEWCFAVHSLQYNRLPDWFLGFDIYDRSARAFWDTSRRDRLLDKLDIQRVPALGLGQFTFEQLVEIAAGKSRLGDGPLEGLVVRRDESGETIDRAKLVNAEFTQSIQGHWSRRTLRRNALSLALS